MRDRPGFAAGCPPTVRCSRMGPLPLAGSRDLFARGLGAAHLGRLGDAERLAELEQAAARAGEQLFTRQVLVLRLVVFAGLAHVQDKERTRARVDAGCGGARTSHPQASGHAGTHATCLGAAERSARGQRQACGGAGCVPARARTASRATQSPDRRRACGQWPWALRKRRRHSMPPLCSDACATQTGRNCRKPLATWKRAPGEPDRIPRLMPPERIGLVEPRAGERLRGDDGSTVDVGLSERVPACHAGPNRRNFSKIQVFLTWIPRSSSRRRYPPRGTGHAGKPRLAYIAGLIT